jgi:hypothetical protein
MQKTLLVVSCTVILMSFLLISCKREFDSPRWNTQVIAPLVKTSLTVKNLIKDTSKVTVKSDSNNAISLVNREQIFDYSLDSLVSLSAPPYHKTVNLSSLQLADDTITQRITLGEIATQLTQQGNSLGAAIISAGKLGFPVPFPGATGLHAGPINIDISKFFQNATLLSGTMNVQIINGLPITINNIAFSLQNNMSSTTIASETFTNILPMTTSPTQSADLSGQTIGSSIGVSINNLDLSGGLILVDTSAAITVKVSISNIQVSTATAIFPAQDVVNQTNNVTLTGMGDKLLTTAVIGQGTVQAEIYSTSKDTIYFSYSIPSALKNGQVFHFDAVVLPANAGGNVHQIFNSDFSGYTLNLTGQDHLMDTFNTFYNTLVGRINYTGKIVTLSLKDSLDITLTLINAKPSYVKGYLGQDTISFGPSTSGLDVFNNISATTLNFSSAQMSVEFDNAIGVSAQGELNQLTAYNTTKGTNVPLTGPSLNKEYFIAPAIFGTPLPTTVTTKVDLTTGTNAVNLLNLLPNKISYQGQVQINPAGNTNTYSDFAQAGVDLKAYFNMTIPLSLIASNLVLSDTVQFTGTSFDTKTFQNGNFNLIVTNGFPLDASITMCFIDQYGTKLDSLITTPIIQPAPIDPVSGKVTGPKVTTIPFSFTSARLNNILQNSNRVIFTAKFNTDPANKRVTLYSNYAVQFVLVGDMNVLVNSGK